MLRPPFVNLEIEAKVACCRTKRLLLILNKDTLLMLPRNIFLTLAGLKAMLLVMPQAVVFRDLPLNNMTLRNHLDVPPQKNGSRLVLTKIAVISNFDSLSLPLLERPITLAREEHEREYLAPTDGQEIALPPDLRPVADLGE